MPGEIRGLKRPSFDEGSLNPHQSSKRLKVNYQEENTGGGSFWKSFGIAVSTVYNKLLNNNKENPINSMSNSDSSSSDEVEYLGESIAVNRQEIDQPKDVDSDDGIQVLHDSLEVQRSAKKSFLIKTKNGKENERKKFKTMNVLKKLTEKHPDPKELVRDFTSSTLTTPKQYDPQKYASISQKRESDKKSIFKPRRYKAPYKANTDDYVRKDDYERYKSTLEKYNKSSKEERNFLWKKLNRGFNSVSSPMFSRSRLTHGMGGAISKIQLSEINTTSKINQTPLKYQTPEVITLDEDSDEISIVSPINRPILNNDDADVLEIVNQYAPKPEKSSYYQHTKKPSLFDQNFAKKNILDEDLAKNIEKKYAEKRKERDIKILAEKVYVDKFRERCEKYEKTIESRLKHSLSITDVEIDETICDEEFPEITDEMRNKIQWALRTTGQVLVEKFNIQIRRTDIETLRGLNWLNDEVINFYLQLICERSQNHDNWPKVYAFNTFFYPKIMDKGHASVKRWTRKVDIFSYDLLLIPVHLGMHWCLATVNIKEKKISYYDSMKGKNFPCLQALEKYLQDEHLDKKKTPLDTSDYQKILETNIPNQMNGSDCGMFTIKFAEYLSRAAEITFTQEDMPYFRERMIYEICEPIILHP